MKDNEIIKALECCIKEEVNCRNCPYEEYRHTDCVDRVYNDVINLINRQKKEIQAYKLYYAGCLNDLKKAHAEIERLQKENPMDAIKEFAKRLKKTYTNHIVCSYSVLNNEIDKLVKEVEDQML